MEENIKNNIKKIESVGLFYQYRPCSINYTTIYDIDNIIHKVLYARSPIHMNDPFDSTISFDEDKIVSQMLDLFLSTIDCDKRLKNILKITINSEVLNKFSDFVEDLNCLGNELKKSQTVKKQNNTSLVQFYNKNKSLLFPKITKKLNNTYNEEGIMAMVILIKLLEGKEITKENIQSLNLMTETIGKLKTQLIEFRDNDLKKAIELMQRKITVTCLSASGWDNHLMWAHYANSFSGICIEYDFTKYNNVIGIFDEVKYSKSRAMVTLEDFFELKLSVEISDDGQRKYSPIPKKDIDLNKLIKKLFIKQNIWNYEKEWRIVNAEEKEDTSRLISVPKIKSITYGKNIDEVCKFLLIDVCLQNDIDIYELVPSGKDFSLSRVKVNGTLINTFEESLKYMEFLIKDFTNLCEDLKPQIQKIVNSLIISELYEYTFFCVHISIFQNKHVLLL